MFVSRVSEVIESFACKAVEKKRKKESENRSDLQLPEK